ncbi:MAG TPA: hypothetical protein VMF65_05075 [Acidimicrobiales bacterium]|nr:hypothetical protein [Acidimicrobiales bacterium]
MSGFSLSGTNQCTCIRHLRVRVTTFFLSLAPARDPHSAAVDPGRLVEQLVQKVMTFSRADRPP